jgi:hypothetical protein
MKTNSLRFHRAQLFAVLVAVLLPSAALLPFQLSNGAICLMWMAGIALIVFVLSDYADTSALHEHHHPDIHPHPGSPQDNPPLAGGDHWPHQSPSK